MRHSGDHIVARQAAGCFLRVAGSDLFFFSCVCVPVVLATPQGKTAGQLPDESHGPAFSKKQLTGEATNYLLLGGSGANDGPSPQQRQTQAKLCQGRRAAWQSFAKPPATLGKALPRRPFLVGGGASPIKHETTEFETASCVSSQAALGGVPCSLLRLNFGNKAIVHPGPLPQPVPSGGGGRMAPGGADGWRKASRHRAQGSSPSSRGNFHPRSPPSRRSGTCVSGWGAP